LTKSYTDSRHGIIFSVVTDNKLVKCIVGTSFDSKSKAGDSFMYRPSSA